MSTPVDPRPVRLSPKLDYLVREFAKKHGLTLNQTINHILAKGFHQIASEQGFRIEDYIEIFFEKE